MRFGSRCVLLVLLVVVAVLLPTTRADAWDPTATILPPEGWSPAAARVVRYQAPVVGEVIRPFTAPGSLFGPGHRGVDLDASPGDRVTAAGNGTVSHAGPVAGTTWVAIAHDDGVVTSYGPLTDVLVARGQRLTRGAVVGRLASGGHGVGSSDRGLHWGARRAGWYVDPLTLLDEGIPRPSLVGAGAWRGTAHVVRPYDPWAGQRAGGWLVAGSPDAHRPGFSVPPSPNHLVVVPGLASSSATRLFDPSHLGYDPRSVTAFSYAGRHDDRGAADDPARDQLPYGPEATWAGTEEAASRLRDQLRAQAAAEPGRAVDLIGHSMGGVVILRYLVNHHDPYDRTLPPIGNVVLIASPLRGSDLAAVGRDLADLSLVGPVLEGGRQRIAQGDGALAARLGSLPLDAPAIGELAVGSPAVGELARGLDDALWEGVAGPLAMGTRLLTIGGSRDPVVVAGRAQQADPMLLEGPQPGWGPGEDRRWMDPAPTVREDGTVVVDHRVLPGGHQGVLDTEAVREVVWRFLAGDEVVESPGRLTTIVGEEVGLAARFGTGVLRLRGHVAAPVKALLRRPTPTVPR